MSIVCASVFAQAALARYAQPQTAVPIDSILMVGAWMSLQRPGEFSQNDELYLQQSIHAVGEAGGRFANQPVIVQCDMPKMDFLRDAPLSAMVVFCKVCYDPTHSHQNRVIDRRACRQSVLAHEDGVWHRALLRVGAQWAVNVHKNEIELPTPNIERPPYMRVATRRCMGLQLDVLRVV